MDSFDGHLRRKDFSRWISNVFGDYTLGVIVSDLEEQYRLGNVSEVAENLVREIQSHYDFAYDSIEGSSTTDPPRADVTRKG